MQRLFNLNSLTDIVSNAIGIAILLALVTFLTSASRTYEVVVPLARESALAPRFFIVRDGALWPVDRAAILRTLGEQAGEVSAPFDVHFPGGASAEIELTDDAGFLVRPGGSGGWIAAGALPSLARAGRAPFAELEPERELAYLFVYDTAASFETLREARRLLVARGVRVGWTIVTEAHPPHLCASPMSGACRYRPSTP